MTISKPSTYYGEWHQIQEPIWDNKQFSLVETWGKPVGISDEKTWIYKHDETGVFYKVHLFPDGTLEYFRGE